MQYLSLRGKDKRIKGRDKWFERNDPVDTPVRNTYKQRRNKFSSNREFRDSKNPNPFLSKLKKNPIEFLPR